MSDNLITSLEHFWHADDGATAIEYGMIAALLVSVIVVGISSLGDSIKDNLYTKIASVL